MIGTERRPLVIEWQRHDKSHWRGSINGFPICDMIRREDRWLLRDADGRTLVGTVKTGQRLAQQRFDTRQEGYGDH